MGTRAEAPRPLGRFALPLVCGLLQALSVGTGSADGAAASTGARSVFIAVGIATGLALLGRHRRPFLTLAAACTGYVVQVLVGGPAAPVAVAVATYSIARAAITPDPGRGRPLRWTAVALVAALLGVVTPLLLTRYVDEVAVYGLVTLMAAVAGLLLTLYAAREDQRRRALVAAERLRIARDLHDVVGHGLGAITVQAGAARMAVAAGADQDATRSLMAIEAAGRGVLREVRWLVGLLREDGEHPGIGDVPDLVDNARRSGLDVALSVDGDLAAVPPGAGEAAYRIVQEALTNVLRHGGGGGAEVVVAARHALEVDVRGLVEAPVPPGTAEGNGVRGMRERAQALGGTLQAGPEPDGRSWTVRAVLPLVGRP